MNYLFYARLCTGSEWDRDRVNVDPSGDPEKSCDRTVEPRSGNFAS
jgi:hypothetical protein